MVGHEPDQQPRRELQDPRGRARPQRRRHRHQVVAHEHVRIALLVQVVAQRRPGAWHVEQGRAVAVEAHDLAHHAQEARRNQVAPLAEQRAQAGGVVFQPVAGVLHRKAHGGRLRWHAEFIEQPREQGIVAPVEHDEAGVHVVLAAGLRHAVRVGVSAQAGLSLEQHHLVLARQPPGRAESGNATAHDRDPHRRLTRQAVPCATRPASP